MSKGYTSVNTHTGALMVSKPATKAYEDSWDRIFGKKVCSRCGKKILLEEPTLYEEECYHGDCLEERFNEEG